MSGQSTVPACQPAITRSNHKIIVGKIRISATRSISAPKNGITPLKSSDIGMSFAGEEMTKPFIPTGGVIRPNSTPIKAGMPN